MPPWSFMRCSDGRRRLGWFWPSCCWRRTPGCPNVLMWSLWNALLETGKFLWLYGELVWKEALMTWDIPISWIFAPRMDSRALASLILYMLCICAGIDNLKFYCMHLLYSLNFEVGAQWALECKAWCLLPLCDLLQFFYADVAWTIQSIKFHLHHHIACATQSWFDFNSGHPTLLAAMSGTTIWATKVTPLSRLVTCCAHDCACASLYAAAVDYDFLWSSRRTALCRGTRASSKCWRWHASLVSNRVCVV